MYKEPPSLIGLPPRERSKVMIDHQVEWEMPLVLRATSISHAGTIYNEKQIRIFAKVLATTACSYRTNRVDVHHPTYRELWEQTATMDEDWLQFHRLFGDEEVKKMIDRAVEQQNRREQGEIE